MMLRKFGEFTSNYLLAGNLTESETAFSFRIGSLSKSVSVLMLITIILCLTIPLEAESSLRPGKNINAHSLAFFFDEKVPVIMEEYHLAGVSLGVADKSGTLFEKGYGFSSLESKKKVEADTTLFRAGSVTKLFVWTSIMQLEQEGLLSLDDPVNQYLDFSIPDNFEEPIRIIDLMNHTPGFEDRIFGLFVSDERDLKSLREVVMDVPGRIRSPGVEVSYSNYGAMLAAYIVQRITGERFEDYVRTHIMDPLKMKSSTLEQSSANEMFNALSHRISVGYSYGGDFSAMGFEYVQGAPAGSLSTTTTDMLRFLRAHLRAGELDGRRILSEETVMKMREWTFRQDPRGNGTAHGFLELYANPHPMIGHGGDTRYFHSIAGIMPADNIVFYISTNTSTGSMAIQDLTKTFLNRFFPVPSGNALIQKMGDGNDRGEKSRNDTNEYAEYEGTYRINRRPESDPSKLISLFMLANVQSKKEGLEICSLLSPESNLYVEIDPDIFQQADGSERVIFLRDDSGEIQSFYLNMIPVFLFHRVSLIEHPGVNFVIFLTAILLTVTILIFPPFGVVRFFKKSREVSRNRIVKPTEIHGEYNEPDDEPDKSLKSFFGAMVKASAFTFVFFEFVFILSLVPIMREEFLFKSFGPLDVFPVYICLIILPSIIYGVFHSWKNSWWGKVASIHFTVFAVFQTLLFILFYHWKLFFF